MAFVTQSPPDIGKKLERMEGFEGENREKLMSVAVKVYNNRDPLGDRMATKIGRANIAALTDGGFVQKEGKNKKEDRNKVWPLLEKDQCAYCKEKGRYRRDCEKLKRKRERKTERKSRWSSLDR